MGRALPIMMPRFALPPVFLAGRWFSRLASPAAMDTPATHHVHVFPLLADAATYRACHWDLIEDAPKRAYWIRHYRGHFPGLLEEAVAVEVSLGQARADAIARSHACRAQFERYLEELETHPPTSAPGARLDILTMGLQRERILRAHGFADPYLLVKQRENEAALKLLPKLLADLDAMPDEARMIALMEGCFAGNIFDVGANATLALFKSGQMDFLATRATLKRRPWRMDDLDAWLARMNASPATSATSRDREGADALQRGATDAACAAGQDNRFLTGAARDGGFSSRGPHRAAVLFVDNAGCDVVLGMIPLARELLRRGTQVILAANTTPSLNDITAAELCDLVARIAAWDAKIGDAFRGGALEVVATGCGTPLIDLSLCSRELVEAVNRRGVDLVILEGMGRAVESNLQVPFRCDVMKIALLKDPSVAKSLGGEMYDPVLRFELAI